MAITAAIHEAKDQFTRLVARAEAGERITITRYGKAVAEIGPVPVVAQDELSDGQRELVRLIWAELGDRKSLPGVPEEFDNPMPDAFWKLDESVFVRTGFED